MFCRCDARGQQCEQSDHTSSYRKGGSLKCSLFIVQIRHENQNKSAEARIQRCNIVTGRNEVVAKVMFLLVSVILLTPQEDGYCCRRYASYWNAFLFCLKFR